MKAMINHDLRAPISALSFWIDNMLLGTYGELDGAMNDSLSRSSRNVKTILSLLDDLVDIEKLESEKMKAVKANVRIQECFDHLSRVFVDWLKETQLSVHFEATDCVVLADFEQLNRILQNFFSNAIKWSPAGTEIRLRAHKQNSFVIIEVEDSGPGIKAEQKEQLFERWGTLNASPRQNSPSSGLGLYISKKLAELQGGAVAVRDSDKGGSIFSVSLPAGSN
jgi:signal transduction histidine kinase